MYTVFSASTNITKHVKTMKCLSSNTNTCYTIFIHGLRQSNAIISSSSKSSTARTHSTLSQAWHIALENSPFATWVWQDAPHVEPSSNRSVARKELALHRKRYDPTSSFVPVMLSLVQVSPTR
jgi:hypothetical protein